MHFFLRGDIHTDYSVQLINQRLTKVSAKYQRVFANLFSFFVLTWKFVTSYQYMFELLLFELISSSLLFVFSYEEIEQILICALLILDVRRYESAQTSTTKNSLIHGYFHKSDDDDDNTVCVPKIRMFFFWLQIKFQLTCHFNNVTSEIELFQLTQNSNGKPSRKKEKKSKKPSNFNQEKKITNT